MFAKLVNFMPILAGSTDSLLKKADFVYYVLVPVAIGIMAVRAIFGKKDKQ